MRRKNGQAVLCALLAAGFYALNTPFSKRLLQVVPPTLLAAFLYLGAGVGVGLLYLVRRGKEEPARRLTRAELPYTVGMIVLDIAAPILLMLGLSIGSAANASLLGNFEIVATALIALLLFREPVSGTLWAAIALIALASAVLTLEGSGSLRFSGGSLLVLLAACCWGLENNCTRQISGKSTYEIVVLKGMFSGGGSLLIALLVGERFPAPRALLAAMALGFVAYGMSIFLYIRAQRFLGAAKTSAYYAAAPFIGSLLAFLVNGEGLTGSYFAALLLMLAGTALVVKDTLAPRAAHSHVHTICHTHDGSTHTHVVTHARPLGRRGHRHSPRAFLRSAQHRAFHGGG